MIAYSETSESALSLFACVTIFDFCLFLHSQVNTCNNIKGRLLQVQVILSHNPVILDKKSVIYELNTQHLLSFSILLYQH